jgi:hypothetical protein
MPKKRICETYEDELGWFKSSATFKYPRLRPSALDPKKFKPGDKVRVTVELLKPRQREAEHQGKGER